MKKLIVTAIGFTALLFSAQAQETRKQNNQSGQRHEKHHMAKELNLTEAQKEQLKTNRESMRAQLADLEKNDQLTVKEYRSKKAEIQKDQKAKMDNILTEEQKQKFAATKMGRHGKDGKHRSFNPDHLKASLNLSDDQVTRLKQNREQKKAALQSIREDKQLTPEQKKEKMSAVKSQSKTFYKETLTPDQYEKMESMKKDRVKKSRK